MTRSVKEWQGKTDDTPVPPRVRLRVYVRDGGICCCGCTRKIQPGEAWETDHTVAIINGGINSESNLRTLLKEHHAKKTALDSRQKAIAYRKRKAHIGLRKPRTMTRWRNFAGKIVSKPRER